jgi:hypothetical protein
VVEPQMIEQGTIGTRFMGWVKLPSSDPSSNVYIWVPDPTKGEDAKPSRNDEKNLKQMGGVHDPDQKKDFFKMDDRAGDPSRPNTTGGFFRPGGTRLSAVFSGGNPLHQARYDPLKKERDKLNKAKGEKYEYFSPQNIQLSPGGTATDATSPGGTQYGAGPTYGDLTILIEKSLLFSRSTGITIDQYGTNVREKSPLPQLSKKSDSITLTPKMVKLWSCRRDTEGANLKTVMSNLSAFEAAGKAGLNPTEVWAWLHLIAYTMGGQDNKDPDVPDNLIAGTHDSNIYHLAIETAVKKIVLEGDFALHITWELDGAIDLNWHIAERVKYTVALSTDLSKSFTFIIHTFKHERAYGADVQMITARLLAAFDKTLKDPGDGKKK